MVEVKEPTNPPAADFKEPVGGGKRDRTPCADGNHDWECKKTGCADCWVPPCEPNREKEQAAYDAENSGSTPAERRASSKAVIQARRDAGEDLIGLNFEEAVLDSLPEEEVLYYSYAAHCKKCHVRAELDVVTRDAVIECKNSASGFKLDQMKTRVMQIAAKCFPEKRVVCATRASEQERLNGKLRQWHGKVGGTLPSMGV